MPRSGEVPDFKSTEEAAIWYRRRGEPFAQYTTDCRGVPDDELQRAWDAAGEILDRPDAENPLHVRTLLLAFEISAVAESDLPATGIDLAMGLAEGLPKEWFGEPDAGGYTVAISPTEAADVLERLMQYDADCYGAVSNDLASIVDDAHAVLSELGLAAEPTKAIRQTHAALRRQLKAETIGSLGSLLADRDEMADLLIELCALWDAGLASDDLCAEVEHKILSRARGVRP